MIKTKVIPFLNMGGDIYYMTGDVDGALKYWKQAQEMGSESKTLKKKIEKKKYIPE